ncbi:MAG: POTRA domain-containing protein [Candidatus Edwardsbacteria bacterium]|nr:POTRA domain-containing protein [Candidatus Edwardsbacteria bacterium]
MRHFLRTSAAIMAAAVVPAPAPAAPAIEIRNNVFYSRAEIKSMLGDSAGRALMPGLRRVVDAYRSAGFLYATASAAWNADSAAVVVTVGEGTRFRAGRPSFNGNAFIAAQYLSSLTGQKAEAYFDQRFLRADLQRISRAYADAGLPHAAVRLSGLAMSGDTVQFGYEIAEGPLVTIAAVRFKGNATTGDQAAQRLAGLSPGRTFSGTKAERAEARLLRSGLFSEAKLIGLAATDEPGRENVLFEVREPRYNSLFGALGYNQGTEQKGWLAGAVDIELRNISGTARQLTFRWERPQQYVSSLRASYREPWLLGSPAGASLSIRHRIQDSLFVQTGGQILFTIPLSDQITGGAGGSAERTVPGSQLVICRSLQYSSLWSLQGDYRDLMRGKTGWQYRLQLSYGRKRYYDPAAQLTISRVEIDAQWSASLFSGQILDLAVHGRALVSSERPAPRTDQYYVGGAGTLRGYFEQQFAASQAAWLNAEYRLTAATGFELYPFMDCGYLRDLDRVPDRVKAGYGLGLRLDTRLGRIQIDYGLGQGDKPSDGKVHLILRSDF